MILEERLRIGRFRREERDIERGEEGVRRGGVPQEARRLAHVGQPGQDLSCPQRPPLRVHCLRLGLL